MLKQPQPTAPSQPFIIEMFAGSARVTACLRFLGLTASFGVDHILSSNVAKVITADLTTSSGQSLFWQWVQAEQCFGVFAAPPCGTCSLARNIPIHVPGSKRRSGPQPLRSSSYPDGLPTLTGSQKARVGAANALYAFLTEIALYCVEHGKVICIENPQKLLILADLFCPAADKTSQVYGPSSLCIRWTETEMDRLAPQP